MINHKSLKSQSFLFKKQQLRINFLKRMDSDTHIAQYFHKFQTYIKCLNLF